MRPVARSTSRRQRLEDAIEKAIALLDAIDGDPDLEPSLGYNPYMGELGAAAVDLEAPNECCLGTSNPMPGVGIDRRGRTVELDKKPPRRIRRRV
jgi:hypothetical protein